MESKILFKIEYIYGLVQRGEMSLSKAREMTKEAIEQKDEFKWTDELVIKFTNWYLTYHKLNKRYIESDKLTMQIFKESQQTHE